VQLFHHPHHTQLYHRHRHHRTNIVAFTSITVKKKKLQPQPLRNKSLLSTANTASIINNMASAASSAARSGGCAALQECVEVRRSALRKQQAAFA
jgi:hypothetical protein